MLLTLAMGLILGGADTTLAVGDRAPDFGLMDQDGKKHRLSDYSGQRRVVYFFPKADTPG